jgi:cytochrome c-type biogenesis protein CcmF
MIAELGLLFTCAAFALSIGQALLLTQAARKGDAALLASGRWAAGLAAVFATFALLALIAGFLRSDFSLAVVAQNSHPNKPLIYKIAGAWGNHEGSMLMWCLVACIYGFAAASRAPKDGRDESWLDARAAAVQGVIATLSFAYLIFASNPFARLDPAPLRGGDLNPLLQDPALAIHPPLLYMGYVGMSVVYSYAIAGLWSRAEPKAWAKAARPWALAAWSFLTIGITLGAYWAYYELGWGGWWFWDPVENASFMPWLAGAALIHSLLVTERRGAFADWSAILAIACFSLSLLGAFLVRSGIITSVHAFALDPARGVWILGLLGLATFGGFGLYAMRARGEQGEPFAMVSKEGFLLINNLVLVVACATVLLGTLFPLISEAVTGATASVGPPYFNATFGPLLALGLILAPAGVLLSWRRHIGLAALRPLLGGAALAVVFALAAIIGASAPWLAASCAALAAWLLWGAGVDLHRRAGGKTVGESLKNVRRVPLRGWAGVLAHAGLGVFALGAGVETSMRQETTIALAVGETGEAGGAKFRLDAVETGEGPNYYIDRARLTVTDGADQYEMAPERRYYWAARTPTTEVAIRDTFGSDLYVAFGEPVGASGGKVEAADDKPRWRFRVNRNPFVGFIFGGSALIALGGLLGLIGRLGRGASPARAPAKTAESVKA